MTIFVYIVLVLLKRLRKVSVAVVAVKEIQPVSVGRVGYRLHGRLGNIGYRAWRQSPIVIGVVACIVN